MLLAERKAEGWIENRFSTLGIALAFIDSLDREKVERYPGIEPSAVWNAWIVWTREISTRTPKKGE